MRGLKDCRNHELMLSLRPNHEKNSMLRQSPSQRRPQLQKEEWSGGAFAPTQIL